MVRKGCVLEMLEYGKLTRRYNDIDYERFINVVRQMILDQLSNSRQGEGDEVKNIVIHLYTY